MPLILSKRAVTFISGKLARQRAAIFLFLSTNRQQTQTQIIMHAQLNRPRARYVRNTRTVQQHRLGQCCTYCGLVTFYLLISISTISVLTLHSQLIRLPWIAQTQTSFAPSRGQFLKYFQTFRVLFFVHFQFLL